jgi:hypothetical protein
MGKRAKLLHAKEQIETLIELFHDDESAQYFYMHLTPIYYEIEDQLRRLPNETT